MSHNSYQVKVEKIFQEAAIKALEAKGDRVFTMYDIEEARKGKVVLALASFAIGIILAAITIHFFK